MGLTDFRGVCFFKGLQREFGIVKSWIIDN